MPRLPTAEDLGTRIARPTRGVVSIAPDQTGSAIAGVADHIGKIVDEETQKLEELAAQDAVNTLERKRLEMTYDPEKGFSNVTGSAVLNRPLLKEVPEAFDNEIKNLSAGLKTKRAQQYFQMRAANVKNGITGDLFRHVALQTDKAHETTEQATIDLQADIAAKDPTRLDSALAIAGETAAKAIARLRLDPSKDGAQIAMLTQRAQGRVVVATLNTMLSADSVDFKTVNDLLKKHESVIPADKLGMIRSKVEVAETDHVADTEAETVWGEIGPQGANDPVRIFDMEKSLRERLKDKPDAMKKGIAGLRERATAFNAQQAESKAGGINDVFGMLDSGTSMAKIRRSDAWLGLPEKDRHDIVKTLESEAHARESRAYTAENRALLRDQRKEKTLLLQNGDQYLTDSDPRVLSRLTRAQVEAKRATYGMDATQQLLNKWDTLQKPGKLSEAKMDKQDFDMVADSLGLSPYAKSLSEDKKRALGTLQFRVEQTINRQQQGGVTLTREQKMALMKQEMAKEVIVDGGLFSRERNVPVIALSPEQVKDVVIPQTDRSTIAQKMADRYKRTQDPVFAPTEDNLRHWYLMSKSQSADLIKGP